MDRPRQSRGHRRLQVQGRRHAEDPCKVVLVKEAVIKFVCKDDQALNPPLTGGLRHHARARRRQLLRRVRRDHDQERRRAAQAEGGRGTRRLPRRFPADDHDHHPADAGLRKRHDRGRRRPATTANTVNADACPADCTVDPCEQTANPGGMLTVNIVNNESGQTTFGVATVFIDYPGGQGSHPRVCRRLAGPGGRDRPAEHG